MRPLETTACTIVLLLLCVSVTGAQQPAFQPGTGPAVAIAADYPNAGISGRVAPWIAEWLEADGYRVQSHSGAVDPEMLRDTAVLFLVCPIAEQNAITAGRSSPEDFSRAWRLPTPSAYTDEEIAALTAWVRSGGSLFVITDHMPFPGAVQDLANAFGITVSNGFAIDSERTRSPTIQAVIASDPMLFSRTDGSIAAHVITDGGTPEERIDAVQTYTGSAFLLPPEAVSLLSFGPRHWSLEPSVAWEFSDATPTVPVNGWSAGGVLRFGQGRIAVFGEAGTFANLPPDVDRPTDVLRQNKQLLLNVVHWMTGVLPE